MALYSTLQKFITKEGAPVEGASVNVKLSGGAVDADLFATRTGTAKGNPFLTTANGEALCYVKAGRYDMTVTKGIDQVVFKDIEVGPVSNVGTFAEGGAITDPDQLVEDYDGNLWAYTGALNHAYQAGTNPKTASGWKSVSITSNYLDNETTIKISEHNSDAAAHPELSEFITSEADRAETAADAATVSGNVYETTTAGLAATVDGDYFSVVSPDDESYLDLYRNESGVAVYKKSYPSVDGVSYAVSVGTTSPAGAINLTTEEEWVGYEGELISTGWDSEFADNDKLLKGQKILTLTRTNNNNAVDRVRLTNLKAPQQLKYKNSDKFCVVLNYMVQKQAGSEVQVLVRWKEDGATITDNSNVLNASGLECSEVFAFSPDMKKNVTDIYIELRNGAQGDVVEISYLSTYIGSKGDSPFISDYLERAILDSTKDIVDISTPSPTGPFIVVSESDWIGYGGAARYTGWNYSFVDNTTMIKGRKLLRVEKLTSEVESRVRLINLSNVTAIDRGDLNYLQIILNYKAKKQVGQPLQLLVRWKEDGVTMTDNSNILNGDGFEHSDIFTIKPSYSKDITELYFEIAKGEVGDIVELSYLSVYFGSLGDSQYNIDQLEKDAPKSIGSEYNAYANINSNCGDF